MKGGISLLTENDYEERHEAREQQSITLQKLGTVLASLVSAAIIGIAGLVYDMRGSVIRMEQNFSQVTKQADKQDKAINENRKYIHENEDRIRDAEYDIDRIMRGLQQLFQRSEELPTSEDAMDRQPWRDRRESEDN